MGIWDRDYMHEDHERRAKLQERGSPGRASGGHRKDAGDRLIQAARWIAIAGSAVLLFGYLRNGGHFPAAPQQQRAVRTVESPNADQVADPAPVRIDFFRQTPSHPSK